MSHLHRPESLPISLHAAYERISGHGAWSAALASDGNHCADLADDDIPAELLKACVLWMREWSAEAAKSSVPMRVMKVGADVFIRTVTHNYTGRISMVLPDALLLVDAAWIACSGRFHNALKDGDLDEVEPIPGPVEIMRGAIIDVTPWEHPLPREQA